MIERRIKRALWAASILIALGFGGHSAYEFRQEVKWEGSFQEWVARSRKHDKECERQTEEVKAKAGSATGWEIINARAYCDSTTINEGVSQSSRVKFEAADAAQQSLAIAVVCPVALWTIFFLLRWIWTGSIRGTRLPQTERRPLFANIRAGANWVSGRYATPGRRKDLPSEHKVTSELGREQPSEENNNRASPNESIAPQRAQVLTDEKLASKSSPKKILATTGVLIAVLIAMVIGKGIGKEVWPKVFHAIFASKTTQFSDDMLASVADQVNKRLPMMVDKDTRLDKARIGPQRQITYYYTLVNNPSTSVDPSQLQAGSSALINETCSNKQLKILFENGVVMNYSYSGNDGRFITQISVPPSDCGYRE